MIDRQYISHAMARPYEMKWMLYSAYGPMCIIRDLSFPPVKGLFLYYGFNDSIRNSARPYYVVSTMLGPARCTCEKYWRAPC
jgi:hypothetical protein